MKPSRMALQRWLTPVLLAGLLGSTVVAACTAWADAGVASAAAAPLDAAGAIGDLQESLRMRPDNADALRELSIRLALQDPRHALAVAQRSVGLNAYDWRNWHELGMVEYQLGDAGAARQAMLREVAASRGFESHFQLANLARLQGDRPLFWAELRSAWSLASPADGVYLLNQAWSASAGDARLLVEALPRQRPEEVYQAIGFLLKHLQYPAIMAAWRGLQCPPDQKAFCRTMATGTAMQLLVDAFLHRDTPSVLVNNAEEIWNQGIVQYGLSGPIAGTSPWRLRFGPDWQGPALSWSPPPPDRTRLQAAASYRLEVHFDGTEAEQGDLSHAYVPLTPGSYHLTATSGGIAGSALQGLQLEVRVVPGPALAVLPLRLDTPSATDELEFTVPAAAAVGEIRLTYQRPSGALLMDGSGWVGTVVLSKEEER